MTTATAPSFQDSGLPTYGQLHGNNHHNSTQPVTAAKLTLEMMVLELNRDLSKISELLKEVSYLPAANKVSRDLFSQMDLLELHQPEKESCWKGLQDERGRLLERRQSLKVEIVKLTGN
jgi:hypothetical protein